jgi:hypothetical protein
LRVEKSGEANINVDMRAQAALPYGTSFNFSRLTAESSAAPQCGLDASFSFFANQPDDRHDQAKAPDHPRDLTDRLHERDRIVGPWRGAQHAYEKHWRRQDQDNSHGRHPPIRATHSPSMRGAWRVRRTGPRLVLRSDAQHRFWQA